MPTGIGGVFLHGPNSTNKRHFRGRFFVISTDSGGILTEPSLARLCVPDLIVLVPVGGSRPHASNSKGSAHDGVPCEPQR
jgi:hypothetical protein